MKEYQSFLLPLDFSKACNYAAERAKELAASYNAKLTILHIIDYLPPTYVAAELPAELSSKEFLLDQAKKHVDEWMSENGLSNCKKIIKFGKPKKIITQIIKKHGVDLVILAPHDDNALIQLFGSVTNAVAQHTDCDVLILREKGKQQ